MDIRGALASIDLTKLSDERLAQIAAGEHPLSVLGAGLRAGEVPALGPGEEEGEERA